MWLKVYVVQLPTGQAPFDRVKQIKKLLKLSLQASCNLSSHLIQTNIVIVCMFRS